MDVSIPCPHCQKPLTAPARLAGKKVRCAHCGRPFVLKTAPEPSTAARPPSNAETLSRSMLMPMPGLTPAPVEEMICRLVPETFGWVDVSAAAREFFGEPGPATFLDAVHPDDRALAREECGRAGELGERHDLVLRLLSADRTWHFVRVNAHARYDRGGKLNHIRCHLVDVTDRIREEQELRRRTEQLTAANEQLRRANERLREAQAHLVQSEKLAAVGTLAAGMAHEINNPLGFASNNASVLERDTAAVLDLLAAYQEGHAAIAAAMPDLAERIARLEQQSDAAYLKENLVGIARSTRRGILRVAQIVANLRAFARLDRSQLTEFDANESLDQAIALLGEHLSRLKIQVARDYAPLPPVECAAASVNQVLFHLLMNAAQAVEDGGKGAGRIRVATRAEGDDVVIEIGDDGCGIPPEVVGRIFDPFFTTKGVGRGTGLGLSISHGTIAEHGGRIDVESAVGKGSCFRVRLPVRPAAAARK